MDTDHRDGSCFMLWKSIVRLIATGNYILGNVLQASEDFLQEASYMPGPTASKIGLSIHTSPEV